MPAIIKKTCTFVLAGERVKIEFESTPVVRQGGLTVDLKPLPVFAARYSFVGDLIGYGSGQIDEGLAELAKRHGAADVIRLCELWRKLHLNDMRAGTRKQNELLARFPESAYRTQTAFLIAHDMLEDDGYRYGSSWLYQPADAADVAEVIAIMDRLDGARIGKAGIAEEAEDDDAADAYLPESDFDNASDIIDSRDVIRRIEALTDFLADHPNHKEAAEELFTLRALEREAEGYGDWSHGETLIRDSYFADYAEQFADDIGAVDGNAQWPLMHIDWEAAARDLQQDYTSVEFGGVTYWLRS